MGHRHSKVGINLLFAIKYFFISGTDQSPALTRWTQSAKVRAQQRFGDEVTSDIHSHDWLFLLLNCFVNYYNLLLTASYLYKLKKCDYIMYRIKLQYVNDGCWRGTLYRIFILRWRLPPTLSLSTRQSFLCCGVAALLTTLTRSTAAASSSARLFNFWSL